MGFQQLIHLSPVILANLFVLCRNLQKMESVQGKTVLLFAVDTVAKYNACKACHGAIVKALRRGLHSHSISIKVNVIVCVQCVNQCI